ncbi:MAG: flagellar protein FlgA [Geminicoccaceae bacterium]|nr:flagellar protein FlgA [Geminicoccaceae bacterium]
MNLFRLLSRRAEAGRPIRVGVIGGGKFGTMFLAQARLTPGLHVLGVADLKPDRARASLLGAGWPEEQLDAPDCGAALASGRTHLTEDAMDLIGASGLEVLVEATGDPRAGVRHALAALDHGRHLVMVNVETDVLVGPLLAAQAAKAGLVYSLAYGDQPALICELVDWARACGFEVVCAGKGTRYLPHFHQSTPATVWDNFGISAAEAAAAGMNAKMFNSFVDGTKSAIEMCAVANATGLDPQQRGLSFFPCGTHDLPAVLRPASMGGELERAGTVEVISDRERDGRAVRNDLRQGVYVIFRAPSAYAAACFAQYGVTTDPSGEIAALWRPFHLIGLELGISIASAALRGEPTGCPQAFRGDVVATAKRDLAAGEVLDGEGGETVWGRLMPAAAARAEDGLPIALAHDVRLKRPVAAGGGIAMADVALDESEPAVALRRRLVQSLR